MPLNIALIYGNSDKIDAIETFEDLQSELQAWGLETRRLKNDRLKCGDVVYTFVNIEENDNFLSKCGFFNKIYICQKLKGTYDFQLVTICESYSYHPYPFQCLIDLVIDSKQSELNQEINQEKKACAESA